MGLKASPFHLTRAESKMDEPISLSLPLTTDRPASCSLKLINAYLGSQEDNGTK